MEHDSLIRLKDLKIKVHSLTVKEEQEIYKALASIGDDALVKTAALQVETLARAIETINGEKFYELKAIKDFLQTLQRHTLTAIWLTWVKEIEEPSITTIDSLKKNSETAKVA